MLDREELGPDEQVDESDLDLMSMSEFMDRYDRYMRGKSDREEMGKDHYSDSIMEFSNIEALIAFLNGHDPSQPFDLSPNPTLRETIDEVWPQW